MKASPAGILAAVLIITLLGALAVRFMSPAEVQERVTFPVLGTFATIVVVGGQDEIPGMLHSADSLLDYLDTQLGRFEDSGMLHLLNTTGRASLDSELGALLLRCDTLVGITGGGFDPTVGLLVELWGFPEALTAPDSASIAGALRFTGWERMVSMRNDSVFLEEGALIDLGAVAKGYAVDRTWELMMEMGASECLVEVGGEVRCGSSTGRIWHVGVRHPRREELAGILAVTDGAVATSGDYECFFIQDGVRYCHLISRETGYPTGEACGATVLAGDCETADALATAAALAGPSGVESFPPGAYRGIIVMTEESDGTCTTHRFGEIPWGS